MYMLVFDRVGNNIVENHFMMKNISCFVCECIIIDEIDEISINRSGCCFDCENEVVDTNRKKWLEGWRPDSNLVEQIKSLRLNSPHSRSPI